MRRLGCDVIFQLLPTVTIHGIARINSCLELDVHGRFHPLSPAIAQAVHDGRGWMFGGGNGNGNGFSGPIAW